LPGGDLLRSAAVAPLLPAPQRAAQRARLPLFDFGEQQDCAADRLGHSASFAVRNGSAAAAVLSLTRAGPYCPACGRSLPGDASAADLERASRFSVSRAAGVRRAGVHSFTYISRRKTDEENYGCSIECGNFIDRGERVGQLQRDLLQWRAVLPARGVLPHPSNEVKQFPGGRRPRSQGAESGRQG